MVLVHGKSLSRALFYGLVPVFAVLITWLTGFSEGFQVEQGLPLPWKSGLICPGPLGILCTVVRYDWLAFGLDVLVYLAIGYGLLLAYVKFFARKPASLPPKQNRTDRSKL